MRLPFLIAAPILAAAIVLPAFAQDDAGSDIGGSKVVLPSECAVEPLAAEDVATSLTDGAELVGFDLAIPLGDAISGEEAAAINDTVRQILACLNGGDYLRVANLTTGNGAKWLIGGLGTNGKDAAAAELSKEPTAREEAGYLRLIAITDPARMADGRYAAFVVLNEPIRPPRGPETILMVFVDEVGVMKLDALQGFSPRQPATEGTPAP